MNVGQGGVGCAWDGWPPTRARGEETCVWARPISPAASRRGRRDPWWMHLLVADSPHRWRFHRHFQLRCRAATAFDSPPSPPLRRSIRESLFYSGTLQTSLSLAWTMLTLRLYTNLNFCQNCSVYTAWSRGPGDFEILH